MCDNNPSPVTKVTNSFLISLLINKMDDNYVNRLCTRLVCNLETLGWRVNEIGGRADDIHTLLRTAWNFLERLASTFNEKISRQEDHF